jgi:lipopolysaccharide transport system ATP-binding protein
MSTVISVENLSKSYRLGAIGGGTLREDINRWWAKVRRKADPTVKIGQEHLARRVGEEFWALRDVSFKVEEGEILGIMGRNGAGKSTLLKILSRVTGPSSGFVKIRGRIASLLEVGTGFHPELTGKENIFLNGVILGMTKADIRTKFDEIVAFSEIEEFIDTPVKRYSSGMYVRLAFAVAAHLEPEILIVDEVLAVGDAQFQKKCLGKMGDVSREGRTVLFVSHNLDAVRNLCRSAIIIHEGELSFMGPVESAVERYLCSGAVSIAAITFERRESVSRTPFFKSACVLNDKGARSLALDVRRGFSVDLTYEIPEPLRNLEVAIRVLTNEGRPVFTSIISEALPEILDQTQQGVRRVTATVPGNFLMPGDYLITIALHESLGQVFDVHEGIFQISIEDTGTIFTKYNHNHMIGVVIRPLVWTWALAS